MNIPEKKNLGFGQAVKWQDLGRVLRMMSHLGRKKEDDFPGDKATEPLQKEK